MFGVQAIYLSWNYFHALCPAIFSIIIISGQTLVINNLPEPLQFFSNLAESTD